MMVLITTTDVTPIESQKQALIVEVEEQPEQTGNDAGVEQVEGGKEVAEYEREHPVQSRVWICERQCDENLTLEQYLV